MLLSVGYSACHWCHVMEHESFEDAETAALMNEHFVSVKVDREERPDVDAIYMEAVQAMTGQGGWPMTVFLDPDGEPVLRRHLLPARAAPRACRAAAWCWRRSTTPGETQRDEIREQARRDRARGSARSARLEPAGGAAEPGGARRGRRRRCARLRQRARRLRRRAEVPARRWRSSCCSRAARREDGAATRSTRWRRRHLRPARRRLRPLLGRRAGSCRTSRRCSTTTRCWPAPTCTAGRSTGDDALPRAVCEETLD